MSARKVVRWIAGLVTVAVIAAVGYVLVFGTGDDGTQLTAHFTRATGLYEGDDVRVLGVKVGSIDSIEPGRQYVTVRFTVDQGVVDPGRRDRGDRRARTWSRRGSSSSARPTRAARRCTAGT